MVTIMPASNNFTYLLPLTENNAADPKYKIARDERDFVKTHLVRVMIEADAPVQRQVCP